MTQAFNTTSSMGRLTLNVLLSFAQLERELASERLGDKAAASRARGLWQAGPRAFGYQVERGRLILAECEAKAVQDSGHHTWPSWGWRRLRPNVPGRIPFALQMATDKGHCGYQS